MLPFTVTKGGFVAPTVDGSTGPMVDMTLQTPPHPASASLICALAVWLKSRLPLCCPLLCIQCKMYIHIYVYTYLGGTQNFAMTPVNYIC